MDHYFRFTKPHSFHQIAYYLGDRDFSVILYDNLARSCIKLFVNEKPFAWMLNLAVSLVIIVLAREQERIFRENRLHMQGYLG